MFLSVFTMQSTEHLQEVFNIAEKDIKALTEEYIELDGREADGMSYTLPGLRADHN